MRKCATTDALSVFIAFSWLLLFAHNGIRAPFSGDDLMNLHLYLSRPPTSLIADGVRYWSASYRPLGGLFYVSLYHWFGFDPLPFRLACFGLLALNLGLLQRFILRLSGSREVAFLALLIAAYHAWFVDLYYSTGTVFDLLCYSFFIGALNVYLSVRTEGRMWTWRRLAALIALYVCALDAKEMAVSLPVLLAAYEGIYHRRALLDRGLRWLWREGQGVVATGLLTLPYIAGKLAGAGSLVENPAYRLTISPARYLHTFHLYLNRLLYQDHVFRDSNTVELLLLMLALGVALGSRPLLFAWCFVLVSLLPVAFIAHYGAFFLYLPMAGWALYAAVLLHTARRMLLRRLVRLRIASIAGLPMLVALFLAPHHQRESITAMRTFQSVQPPSRQLAGELIALCPRLPRGARVLFVGDPFAHDEYFLLFLTRLLYRDMSITVDRAPCDARRGGYDAVFAFQQGQLTASIHRTLL